jgi:hypothetical protein
MWVDVNLSQKASRILPTIYSFCQECMHHTNVTVRDFAGEISRIMCIDRHLRCLSTLEGIDGPCSRVLESPSPTVQEFQSPSRAIHLQADVTNSLLQKGREKSTQLPYLLPSRSTCCSLHPLYHLPTQASQRIVHIHFHAARTQPNNAAL